MMIRLRFNPSITWRIECKYNVCGVCVRVLFALSTDQASTTHSNILRGCQSVRSEEQLQSSNEESKKQKQDETPQKERKEKRKRNDYWYHQ